MKEEKGKKKFHIKKFLAVTIIFLAFLIGLGIGFFANLVKDIPLFTENEIREKIKDLNVNSDVYFSNNEKISTINSELIRKTVPFNAMGETIKKAIIASEDANFYNNSGIEPQATLRATYNEITGKSISGGSTITQQLIKNQLLDNSRSYERKSKEILIALRITKYISKNEILESYLNMASFGKNKLGQNICGIETASLGVFGVHSKDLNIAQASYLAGFVQSPFKYTPFDNKGNIKSDEELSYGFNRQKYVLNRMLDEHFITKKQYDEAINFDIKSSFIKELNNGTFSYPYITDAVIKESSEILAKQMAEKEGNSDKFKNNKEYRINLLEEAKIKFISGGYSVKTTINKDLYNKLQEARDNYSGFISQNGQNIELGACVIDNKTGKVLSFIGGRSYDKNQLNHAMSTYRSPGSTIKPLLVYGPAIDKGYITTNSAVLDKKFNYKGWSPNNFTKMEYGIIPARMALSQSLNLSTIRLYSAFYKENPVKEYLKKMDFEKFTENDEKNLATSIGGVQVGVSVLENTNAFATLANEGNYNKAYMVDEIRNNNGDIVYMHKKDPKKIYKKETSYLTVDMLKDVIKPGASAQDIKNKLNFDSSNIFLKTGTSEFNHDLWVVGGTKNVTLGLWTGYDNPQEISGYQHAHNQWAYFMNSINDLDTSLLKIEEDFSKPDTVENSLINKINNEKGDTSDIVPNWFKKLSEEKVYLKFGYLIDENVKKIIKVQHEEKNEKTVTKNNEEDLKEENNSEESVSEDNNSEDNNSEEKEQYGE
ncbi:transglycosylase domain-containing protein [Gemelliphila asaccharolytica]|uniref:Transglycosylase n=1 Tax=Gemelliphila asaccharolytica TaxID=502393 RepID=A0ABR5TPZ5_9BACL|nr:transglycosylase domain-containing protein [Gemella asaccharolytica]KXB59016.1 transglycosylase [Gemella asaccharolytica]